MNKYLQLFTMLIFAVLLTAGCSLLEQQTPSASISQSENMSVDAEPVSALYHSIGELVNQSTRTPIKAMEGDETVFVDHLDDISHIYAPSSTSFPGYILYQIQVLPDYVIYYYTPGSGKITDYDYDKGIMVVCHIDKAISLNSISNQLGITIDGNGFIYDKERADLYFQVDSTVITVRVPDELNDCETIKSLYTMEKILLE